MIEKRGRHGDDSLTCSPLRQHRPTDVDVLARETCFVGSAVAKIPVTVTHRTGS